MITGMEERIIGISDTLCECDQLRRARIRNVIKEHADKGLDVSRMLGRVLQDNRILDELSS